MANLDNLDFKNLNPEQLQLLLKEQKVTKEDIIGSLKSGGVSEEEINRLLELSQNGESTEVVVEKAKDEMSNIFSRRNLMVGAFFTIMMTLLLLWGLSEKTTNSTNETAPDKIEDIKPDVEGVEVIENIDNVAKTENEVKPVEGGNEDTLEAVAVVEEVKAENKEVVEEDDDIFGNISEEDSKKILSGVKEDNDKATVSLDKSKADLEKAKALSKIIIVANK